MTLFIFFQSSLGTVGLADWLPTPAADQKVQPPREVQSMHSPQVDHQEAWPLFASTPSTSWWTAKTPETPVPRSPVLLALQISEQASIFIGIPFHGHMHHWFDGGCQTCMVKVTEHECQGVRVMVETTAEFHNFADPWVCCPDCAISTLRVMQQQSHHWDYFSWVVSDGEGGLRPTVNPPNPSRG